MTHSSDPVHPDRPGAPLGGGDPAYGSRADVEHGSHDHGSHDHDRDHGHGGAGAHSHEHSHGAHSHDHPHEHAPGEHRTDEAIEDAAAHGGVRHAGHAHGAAGDAVHGSRADVEADGEDTAERVAEAAAAPEDRRAEIFPPTT